MIIKLLSDELTYDGTQLNSRFIAKAVELPGDACVAFFGPADVPTANLVDEEDRSAGATIKAERMAHFLIRLSGRPLETAVAFQRLVMAGILENLLRKAGGADLSRDGDDIYLANISGKHKLSVSIATSNGAGDCFIHIGVNVSCKGAPVPAAGLSDLGLDEREFAAGVMTMMDRELAGIGRAVLKVRPVE